MTTLVLFLMSCFNLLEQVIRMKVHLDTDLGGDIDDLCALALLLRWPEPVEITGITSVADVQGKRAGYVQYVLAMEGRKEIPVAAGAEVSQGFYRYAEMCLPDESRYWPEPISPKQNPLDEALELLKNSIENDAVIIGIGPYTNLYFLNLKYPGILEKAKLFLMGGYIFPVRPGYPQWGNNMDWNIQVEIRSARHVLEHSSPTLVPISVSVETALRRVHLEDLRKAGPLGWLIAEQAEEFALDEQMEKKYGKICENVPDDIINFQHDPLACAIALGWRKGIEIEDIPLKLEVKEGWLHEEIAPAGKSIKVVTKIDGGEFNRLWIDLVSRVMLSAKKI
jgi:purine nucleosidase